jgi:glutamate N-acetyltransferase / amino-acid N-acetyltransferase
MEWLSGGGVTSARGFRAGAVAAGIKKSGALDLAVIWSDRPAAAAGVFTTNKVRAAPVILSEERVRRGVARGIVVNAGNANACTAQGGLADAREMAGLTGERFGGSADDVLVASTGVIGVRLPMEKVRAGISRIELSAASGTAVANAIMTTDTRPKEGAIAIRVGDTTVTIGGSCKGSGMIHPNMATLLAFMTTDAAVDPSFLATALRAAADSSFNLVSVDGDTSTNDSLFCLANGAAGNPTIRAGSADAASFQTGLHAVAIELAKEIARDGEGATKLLEVQVEGARSEDDARRAARSVTSSSLFKAAVHGCDPNWGRILCALGYSGAEVDPLVTDVCMGEVWLMREGQIQAFDKSLAADQMRGDTVVVYVNLHQGDGRATAWGCDLTEQYVDINGKYTT